MEVPDFKHAGLEGGLVLLCSEGLALDQSGQLLLSFEKFGVVIFVVFVLLEQIVDGFEANQTIYYFLSLIGGFSPYCAIVRGLSCCWWWLCVVTGFILILVVQLLLPFIAHPSILNHLPKPRLHHLLTLAILTPQQISLGTPPQLATLLLVGLTHDGLVFLGVQLHRLQQLQDHLLLLEKREEELGLVLAITHELVQSGKHPDGLWIYSGH